MGRFRPQCREEDIRLRYFVSTWNRNPGRCLHEGWNGKEFYSGNEEGRLTIGNQRAELLTKLPYGTSVMKVCYFIQGRRLPIDNGEEGTPLFGQDRE